MRDTSSLLVCELDRSLIQRFADGGADRSERRRVIDHLLDGCPVCKDSLRGRFQLMDDGKEASISMSRVLANVADFARRLDHERAMAADHWTDFRKHPSARQWTLLRNSSRFDTWPFCERLLQAGYEALYDDPHRALDLNRMALLVAERLRPEACGERGRFDILAGVWGRIANSLRATSDLQGAESALQTASEHMAQGSGEPLTEAEHLYFRASILRARRRLPEAQSAIRRSRRIYRLIHDLHLEGRSLLCEAAIHDLAGDVSKAEECTRTALAQIEPERDSRLALAVRHNLVWYLMCAGRAEEARQELEVLKPLYYESGDRMNLLRLRWMEGRIHRLLGRTESAEAALRESHLGFVEAEIPYEAATVALDLAVLLFERGRVQELKPLAADLVTVFQSLGVGREALAALAVFERAAQAEIVTLGLIAKLGKFLTRARTEPGLSFDHDA